MLLPDEVYRSSVLKIILNIAQEPNLYHVSQTKSVGKQRKTKRKKLSVWQQESLLKVTRYPFTLTLMNY